jgi:hypothetical protein
MLEKVEIRTDQGVLLTLVLEDISDGLILEDIEGLDPVKATLVTSSFANLDGVQYHTARREPRNMVFKLKLEPDYVSMSVRQLRSRLYNFFMPKSNVNMRFFMEGLPPVDISGRVETFAAPLFVKEPKATITLLCVNADFVDLTPVVVNGSTTSGAVQQTIAYPGTIETGFRFKLFPNRSLNEFTIFHQPADGSIRILEFMYPLVAGDVLDISTVSRAKGAWLTRGSTESSVLYGVSAFSDWINLFPGDNLIRVFAEGAAIPYSIEYTTKYGGL